jgi:hydroxylamine reductase (hybrid-cluster protein)
MVGLMKERLLKNLKKIGLDALGIILCGGSAYGLGYLIPILHGFEVFIGVAAGLWLYEPVRKLLKFN